MGFMLFIVFLILKLTEVITWSWWVTAPLWIPWGIIASIIIVPLIIAVIALLIAWLCGKTI